MNDAHRQISRAQDNLAETITTATIQWLATQGVVLTDNGAEKLHEIFRYYQRGF